MEWPERGWRREGTVFGLYGVCNATIGLANSAVSAGQSRRASLTAPQQEVRITSFGGELFGESVLVRCYLREGE